METPGSTWDVASRTVPLIVPVRVWAERPEATSMTAIPKLDAVLIDTLKSSFLLPADRSQV
jgi:hypothetical protein